MGAVSSGQACLCLLSACPACPCPEPPAAPAPCSPAASSREQQLQPCTGTWQPPPAPSSAWFTDLPPGYQRKRLLATHCWEPGTFATQHTRDDEAGMGLSSPSRPLPFLFISFCVPSQEARCPRTHVPPKWGLGLAVVV